METLEIGEEYLPVFEQNKTIGLYITGINFLLVFSSIFIVNLIIKSGLKKFFEKEKKPMPKLANKTLAFVIAMIVSFVTSGWLLETTMKAINATQFNISDPIFNLDVGYFMFQKPFIEMCIEYFVVLFAGLAIYTGIYHIITFNVCFDSVDGEMLRKSMFIRLLLSFAMIVVLGIAGMVITKSQDVVMSQFLTLKDTQKSTIRGAGLTEQIIQVWGYRLLAFIMIVAIFLAIKSFKKQNTKKVILYLMSVPAYLFVLFITLVGYQYLFVNQNELDKQKYFISKNIEFTKTAYNINIDEVTISETTSLTKEDANEYSNIINNIPIVTSDIVLSTLTENQSQTGYYTYNSSRANLYKHQLAYISAREISNDSRTYNGKTYNYTHGYGAVITSASKVDESGNLSYILNNVDDTSVIKQPRIYYGLKTNDTIVVKDSVAEFDYPTTSGQYAENSYEGKGGISLSFFDRLLIGISHRNLKLAFEGKNNSILINRNIVERAKAIMPYLIYDNEPYMVISNDGKLVWVLDAYTTSDSYPYSQTTTLEQNGIKKEINYIRNSIKVIIDAYDGTIDFYITDRTDPIVMSYNNMYSGLFKDSAEIPEDISNQFVYSKMLYKIQADILKKYHNVATDVLYRGDDIWDAAIYSTSTTTTAGESMTPYYTMLKTVNSDKEKLGLVLPYTIYGKQSITSYLVGTCEGAEQKLVLYKYSQDNNILGPLQLNNLLSQDESIAADLATISVTGTRLIKDMVIVPLDNSLLYVVPIYQLSLNENLSTPILKKIVVASGTKVAIGDNLQDALQNLLSSTNSVEIEVENTDTVDELIETIIKANKNLSDSITTADLEQMGKDITKLQDLIRQLEVLKLEEEKANLQKDKNTLSIENEELTDLEVGE